MHDNLIHVEREQLKKKKRKINKLYRIQRSLPTGAPNLSTRPEFNLTRLRTSKLTNELFDDDGDD
jgi:hypothetical protein